MPVLSVLSVPSVRTLFFKTYTNAYRAVEKKKSAYAAMPVWGYRGVTSGTPRYTLENAKLQFGVSTLESPWERRTLVRQVLKFFALLRALCANPSFIFFRPVYHANLKSWRSQKALLRVLCALRANPAFSLRALRVLRALYVLRANRSFSFWSSQKTALL